MTAKPSSQPDEPSSGRLVLKGRRCSHCAGPLEWTQWAGTLQCSSCRIGTIPAAGEAIRVRCCVPFCERTRGDRKGDRPLGPGTEWICSEHWQLVPRRLKLIRSRLKRRTARFGWTDTDKLISDRAWSRCKRAAIEAAAGL
ncbi:hypothetical protein V5F40_21625 [Xanthobacter sp. DSM 14520]|uniref:hypothetical protein n=1 Tax=Xanthobacter autotrophicus (strain ATCC BAA-1158 / Py2) TaxID=78245 RepID=UPI003727B3B7